MNSSNEPTMQGKYKRSLIIERGQRKIGILGALIETVYVRFVDNKKFYN